MRSVSTDRSAGLGPGRGRPAPDDEQAPVVRLEPARLGEWRVFWTGLAFGLGAFLLVPLLLVFWIFNDAQEPMSQIVAWLAAIAFGVASFACLALLLAWIVGRCLTSIGYAVAAGIGAVLGYLLGEPALLIVGPVVGCAVVGLVATAIGSWTRR